MIIRHPKSYRDHLCPVLFDRETGLWLKLDKEEAALVELLTVLLEQHYWHGANGLAYARWQSLGKLVDELIRRWRGRHDRDAGPIETDLAVRSLDDVSLAIFDRRLGKSGKWNWFRQMSEEEWNAWLVVLAAQSRGREDNSGR
jgi:hypothetical protein